MTNQIGFNDKRKTLRLLETKRSATTADMLATLLRVRHVFDE